jgi:hypothetical protein
MQKTQMVVGTNAGCSTLHVHTSDVELSWNGQRGDNEAVFALDHAKQTVNVKVSGCGAKSKRAANIELDRETAYELYNMLGRAFAK